MGLFDKFFGSHSDRELKKIYPIKIYYKGK